MTLNLKQWFALVCIVSIGIVAVWVLVPLLAPDDADDARQCRSHGGVYLWHKRECLPRTAKARV